MNLGYRSFIFSLVFIKNALLAQSNWSIEDLKVTTFRNGDALLEVSSTQNLKFCSENQQPAYFKNVNSKDTFYLYNYYAVIDPRGLAPVGYKIPSVEDLKTLNDSIFYQEPTNSWKTRGKGIEFYAKSNGYLSHDNLEVLSDSVAGYYWTNSTANTLKSFVYIFIDNEPGFARSELPRESFCSVRCISNEKELKEFHTVENMIGKQKKYSDFKKIVSLDERILELKDSNHLLEDEKKQILEYLNNIDLVLKKNKSDLSTTEIELTRILNQTSNVPKSIDSEQKNPFGTGGDGGGKGSGSGLGPFGNNRGKDGDGPGGNGSGKGRIRLNDPRVDHIETSVFVIVHLKLTVNEDGQVISASSTSKTTTTDQRIINQVISAVESQVKYNKDPGAGLVSMFLTVKINAL
jgi:uncharacterized protein (TIGR02145 family)